MRKKVELLKDHARGGQDFPFCLAAGINSLTVFGLHQEFILDGNAALINRFQFIYTAQKGALAGAGRADNRQHFPAVYLNINAFENFQIIISFINPRHFQHDFARISICHNAPPIS